jgi:hypothetical protein
MGIENIKNLVIFGSRMHSCIRLAYQDRKIDGADLIYLIPALQTLAAAVQGIDVLIPEFKDLDSGEVEQLIALIKQEDPALTSDVVAMERIAVCLKLGVAILETYKVFTKKETV